MDKIIREETTDMAQYNGYTLCRDGRILSPRGKALNAFSLTYPGSHVTMNIEGKNVKRNRAILIYNAFSEEPVDTTKFVVRFKDGDTYNASYDNLYLVTKKEYYESRAMNGKPKFSSGTKRNIRKEYKNNNTSMRSLCQKYNCSLLTMQKILAADVKR